MVFAKQFARLYEILRTLDAWSMSHLSHRPSEPAYYIVDCWIFTRLFNDQLIKVTLIKGIVQPLSCYLQSGTPIMSKDWLLKKLTMTVFVF